MLVHVEIMRHLEMMKDASRKDGFEGIHNLAQCGKSRLRITWNDTELKSRLIPCRTMDLNPGLQSAEVLINT